MRTVDTPPSSRYMSLEKLLDTGGRLAIPGNQTLSNTQDSGRGILKSQGICRARSEQFNSGVSWKKRKLVLSKFGHGFQRLPRSFERSHP